MLDTPVQPIYELDMLLNEQKKVHANNVITASGSIILDNEKCGNFICFIIIKSSSVTLATAESLGSLLKKPKCYLYLHICNQFGENNWGVVGAAFLKEKKKTEFFLYDCDPANFNLGFVLFFFFNKSVLGIELRQIMSHLHPK